MCMCVRTRWASSIKWSFKESLSLPAKTRPSDIQGVVKPGSVCVCVEVREHLCVPTTMSAKILTAFIPRLGLLPSFTF